MSNWLGQTDGFFVDNGSVSMAAPADWSIVGTGDFNGDGFDDILWQSDSGEVGNWLGQANGGFVANNANIVSLPTQWHVADVGDYNGDGRDDILVRSDTGAVSNWLSTESGSFVANDSHAYTDVPLDWHIQRPDYLL